MYSEYNGAIFIYLHSVCTRLRLMSLHDLRGHNGGSYQFSAGFGFVSEIRGSGSFALDTCSNPSAILSIIGSVMAFVFIKTIIESSQAVLILAPVATTFSLFVLVGWFSKKAELSADVQTLLQKLVVQANNENR